MSARVDIIYAETLEQLDSAMSAFLDTHREWEPSGSPFHDREGRRWCWAMRLQRGAKPLPPGEVSLREQRR
jgi:hypothetical protein